MKNTNGLFYKTVGLVFGICLSIGFLLHGKLYLAPINLLLNGGDYKEIAEITESTLAEGFYRKDDFVTFNGFIHKLFLQRSMNGVMLLSNGHGSSPMENCSDEILIENAAALKEFSEWCRARGTTLLYTQIPFKNEAGNSQLPLGAEDSSNDVANRFGQNLLQLGVDYLDLRECIREDNVDFYSLFYKTEHHWNCYGGFYAFTKICEYMQNHYGDEVDSAVLEIDNYNLAVYENMHFGPYGNRVGKIFLPPEDFFLLYPKFDTKQSCRIVHRDVIRRGSFYDAIYDQSFLDTNHVMHMAGAYIGGDYPLVIHESDTAKIDETVVVFIDSFGTIPESYLTTVYKRVVAVDLRWVLRNEWEVTGVDYVEQYDAEHVIVMFNPNQLVYKGSEQFEYGVNK